ncbi:MAG TPA: HAD family hydrolase [Polyangiaceae bacterium]|jgi:beta-phosphoglucomutase-like phosphatase (HAD superfamily)
MSNPFPSKTQTLMGSPSSTSSTGNGVGSPGGAPPVYRRLDAARQTALLQSIVDRCAHDPIADRFKPTPVVVFDLDGTLFDNRPRTCTILQELAETWRASHPAEAARLLRARPEELAYLLADTLDRLGITHTECVAEAQIFWRDRFFADDHLKYDLPLAGSVEFAKSCYEAGAILVYLTGRDLPLMGIGSFRSLRDHGFPIGVPGTELVLKPDAAMADEAFKRLEAPKLARVGRIVASFDNEPGNCNTILAQNPECESVLIDTQHLPGAPPLDAGVHVVGDFRRG